jgi:hypothetical protein
VLLLGVNSCSQKTHFISLAYHSQRSLQAKTDYAINWYG